MIRALQDGRLCCTAPSDKTVFIVKDEADKLTDAATGRRRHRASDRPTLDTVRVNNRVRGAIDAALGALTLAVARSRRALRRREAVFKSRDASALASARQRARQGDRTRASSRAMRRRAPPSSLSADKASDEEKLAAVDVIRERADQDALGLLDKSAADRPRRRS